MSSREGRPAKVLSCSNCRTRKIKCDKIQPLCGQCSRFGLDCVFPSRKPTRRAPRPRQSELLDRISRLESIVNQADPAKLKQLDEGDIQSLQGTTPSLSATLDDHVQESQAVAVQAANIAVGEQYLSSGFWGNLCAEVEGIRQALNQTSESDDEDEEGESPESGEVASTSPSGYLLGNSEYTSRQPLIHPPPEMIIRLWAIYTRNVDPLMKILHRPTINKHLQAYIESPTTHTFSPEMNAVMFAIYFCAAGCLTPESCFKQLGESKEVLARRYRIAVERALAEADYLSTTKIETLQALTLYTSVMRVLLHDRTSWVLTSLIIRIAQGLNLHRDGDGHRFTPFVAEMRRRLWHFIVVLDIRGSEDRGSDAILIRSAFDTIEPTPIDDDAFGPASVGPLIPKTTPAENVVCMCAARCSGIFGFLSHPHYSPKGEPEHFLYAEEELISHIRQLESSFIHTAKPSHLPSIFASEVARIVILKLWLNIQYPFNGGPAPDRPRVSKETMLRTAISIIELRERMTKNQWEDRFAWWTDTYVQWHPLAVALAELCIQTEGELVEKAWVVVERTFPSSREHIADTAKGSLWRPIKKLLKKARAARTEALLKRMDFNANMNLNPATSFIPPTMGMAQPMQYDTSQQMNIPVSGPGQQYDTINMDPSILFDPPETLNMDFGMGLEQGVPMEWTYWTEFFNDTQIETSPGSGTGESTS
ncbi:transcription factor [Fusarium austroafricanum]|uniref:Transcription factor n=1 Tax=Fusarium austroafricanum TaxID=2364996 RepID=A0A8H4KJ92_9HYPO|nr:transcription factor [Fusarium austroafricanum]